MLSDPCTNTESAGGSGIGDDSDGSICMICYDNYTNSGGHRISCLKCGHLYGKNCIEEWLKLHGRCPQCNCKALKRDVRILYVKSLQAVDNTELTRAQADLEVARITISNQSLENAKLRNTMDSLMQQVQVLQKQNLEYKNLSSAVASQRCISCSRSTVTGSAATTNATYSSDNSKAFAGKKQLRFNLAKFIEVKEGPCRVGAYSEWLNLLVVSHDMKSSLYPNGCSGIKQVNMLELRPTMTLPMHTKQIRDLQFSPQQTDVLLSVSLDKKAMLHNCNGNVKIQSFQTEYPLWSCVWDEVQHHIFYVGCSNGQIVAYDIRSPQEPLATFAQGQGQDRSPLCRLKFVRPAYQSNAFNLSGLLIQQLNSVSFGELRGGNNTEIRFHQLPVEGPFVSLDFEPVSRHILISTRPSIRQTDITHTSHLLCHLTQYYSDTLERNVVASNLVRSYEGTNRDVQKLCRSCIYSPEEGYIYVLANGIQNTVKYWDISMPETTYSSISNAPELIWDFVPSSINSNRFLTLVSENGPRIFNQSLF